MTHRAWRFVLDLLGLVVILPVLMAGAALFLVSAPLLAFTWACWRVTGRIPDHHRTVTPAAQAGPAAYHTRQTPTGGAPPSAHVH